MIRKKIYFHLMSFVTGTALFILLFHTPLFAPMIFFYRGIIFLFIICIIYVVVLMLLKVRAIIPSVTYYDIILTVTVLFCLNLVFFTLVPVTADRSISVYFLGYMGGRRSNSVTEGEFTKSFIQTYVNKNGAIDKRFNEQIHTGTITRMGDGYRITPFGQFVLQSYKYITKLFGINTKNLSM